MTTATPSLPSPPRSFRIARGLDERVLACAIAAITLVPLAVVLASLFNPQGEVWAHLAEFVLPSILVNTALLMAGVAVGTLVLGVSLAWLTAVYDFPGRKYFAWLLALPLAMPAYVLAFVQIGLYDFTGPLQTWLREVAGGSSWVPPIRSRGGVILTLTVALYPYVYLLARNAFLTQGRKALEAAASLGLSRRQGFWRVALPMARPWIAGGLGLALMECLADFGTVAMFNYDTFTTAIYKAWFGLFNLTAASQLASLLLLAVLVLALVEQHVRGDKRYATTRGDRAKPHALKGFKAVLAVLACLVVLAMAFGIPLAQLLWWAKSVAAEQLDVRYLGFVGRSLLLSAGAALAVVLVALALAYSVRRWSGWPGRVVARLATLGYAVPGTVLAVGVFIPTVWFDQQLINLLRSLGWATGTTAIVQGTLLAMLLAYAARFMAVAFEPVQAAMQRITRSQEEAAASMGLGRRAVLGRIHLPLLRGGLFTAALMVFVDVMKEMPITLMTRPFGWDTLAVRVFEMTSEGQWEMAALPAVAIVLAGLLPVVLLARETERTS